jgi:hypothetical protein
MRRTLILAALVAIGGPTAAAAQNFGGLSTIAASPGGLSFERARAGMPGLNRVTFDHADRNGDGVVDATEFPVLQSLYDARRRND